MSGKFMNWRKFSRQYLDPPPSRRVGRRWIEQGEIEGRIIDGEIWVDMDAWRKREPVPPEVDLLS